MYTMRKFVRTVVLSGLVIIGVDGLIDLGVDAHRLYKTSPQ